MSPPPLFSRRLRADASPLLESKNVGMPNIQERLITRKYRQKLNFDANTGKEFRDLYSVETSVMRHKTNILPP